MSYYHLEFLKKSVLISHKEEFNFVLHYVQSTFRDWCLKTADGSNKFFSTLKTIRILLMRKPFPESIAIFIFHKMKQRESCSLSHIYAMLGLKDALNLESHSMLLDLRG